MPSIQHCFRISINFRYPAAPGPSTNGINAANGEDVDEIGVKAGLEVSGGEVGRQIEIDLDEKDPRLLGLYEAIWEKYQLKPSPHQVLPVSERHLYFGVRRKVTWSKNEINASEWLCLQNTLLIAADACCRTNEQLSREDYVAERDPRQRSAVQFGSLMPFTGLAVAEPLRSLLIAEELQGLHLPAVRFVSKAGGIIKPLWALRSKVILPPPLNLLLGEHGHPVEPNTEWWCWWDDGARDPVTLRYERAEMEALGPFDIAMTNERVGQTEQGAYRQCIVSQRFREVMTRLKVRGVRYVPVELF